ncbi:MAG: cation transporting ATPase C-terminal domain-containing protein [Thermodesulfobacteriota bacterium]
MTGGELAELSSDSILAVAARCNIRGDRARSKERMSARPEEAGNVVGFIGGGINDAPAALHAADVGISVDSAADVARQAADIVLEKGPRGLVSGVREGGVTFANTLKYVFMATSANFGNMFSVAGASFFLTFLPLLPKQILLTNLMTDIPEMTIAGDSVDDEMVSKPRKWDIKFIRNFMAIFGVISSVFDYVTFGVLLFLFHAPMEGFRTGWFVERRIRRARDTGHQDTEAVPKKQAGEISGHFQPAYSVRRRAFALLAARGTLRFQPASVEAPGRDRSHGAVYVITAGRPRRSFTEGSSGDRRPIIQVRCLRGIRELK